MPTPLRLSVIAHLFVVVVLTSFAHAPRAAGQAPVPSHNVGDAVGFGVQLDLGPFVQPSLDELRQQFADPNTTVNELNFTGSLDAWHSERVIDNTSTHYVIQENTAVGLDAHFRSSITSITLPREGTYTGTINPTFGCQLPLIPMETRTITANLDFVYLTSSSGTTNWSHSEFAVLASVTNEAVDLSATFVGRNLPDIDVNLTACRETVTYQDVTYRIFADVDATLRAAYNPALDVFDFPIVDGQNWTVSSTQTVSGTLRGTIDVQGLDPADEEAFFTALNAALTNFTVSGLDSFPIVLERVTIALGLNYYLRDGVLDDISSPVTMQLQARTRTMTLDGQPQTVYEISMYTLTPTVPYFACYYSPSKGFIVSCALVADATSGVTIFELENVPPAQADANIQDTRTRYIVSAPGNPLADFFLKFPYIGLFLVVAAVIVIAAVLSRRRRKPAPMAPPAMEVPPPRAPIRPPEEPSPEEL